MRNGHKLLMKELKYKKPPKLKLKAKKLGSLPGYSKYRFEIYKLDGDVVTEYLAISWDLEKIIADYRKWLLKHGYHPATAYAYSAMVRKVLFYFKRFPSFEDVTTLHHLASTTSNISWAWQWFISFLKKRRKFNRFLDALKGGIIYALP